MKSTGTYDDNELIALIHDREHLNVAIRSIYNQFSEAVSAFIMSKGGSLHDAEDIFQETVMAFIEIVNKGKFRGEAAIKTFLISIARNIWYNALTKKTRTAAREKLYDLGTEKETQDISHEIAAREVKQELSGLMDQLGESCKKILIMFYYDNLSTKEMLEKLPYENEQVVRNKKYKCLQQLSELIKSRPGIVAQMNEFLK
ncbi:MAG: RNA polymerase sigma factor [Chitinophagales bacterium]